MSSIRERFTGIGRVWPFGQLNFSEPRNGSESTNNTQHEHVDGNFFDEKNSASLTSFFQKSEIEKQQKLFQTLNIENILNSLVKMTTSESSGNCKNLYEKFCQLSKDKNSEFVVVNNQDLPNFEIASAFYGIVPKKDVEENQSKPRFVLFVSPSKDGQNIFLYRPRLKQYKLQGYVKKKIPVSELKDKSIETQGLVAQVFNFFL